MRPLITTQTSGANVVGGYAAGNPVVTPNNANLGSRPVAADASRVFVANNTPQNPQSARALGAYYGLGIWAGMIVRLHLVSHSIQHIILEDMKSFGQGS